MAANPPYIHPWQFLARHGLSVSGSGDEVSRIEQQIQGGSRARRFLAIWASRNRISHCPHGKRAASEIDDAPVHRTGVLQFVASARRTDDRADGALDG
jgi:hypothetical protein